MEVLNVDTLVLAVEWMTIANNALYTAIDFISQLILVSAFYHTLRYLLINFHPPRVRLRK